MAGGGCWSGSAWPGRGCGGGCWRGRLLAGVFSRQRRRVIPGAFFWAGHQTCEAMVPVAIGLTTLFSLGAGLIGDDIWDLLAAATLALPVLAASWLGLVRRTQRLRRR